MASFIFDFIQRRATEGKQNFVFYSDNCGGQNKNRFMFAMLAYASAIFGVSIIHRFLECGHTQNEGDSMHSAIESAARDKDLFTPDEWINVMESARSDNPYEVIKVTQDLVFDLKDLVSHMNTKKTVDGTLVPWSKIREVKFSNSDSHKLYFKVNFDDEYSLVDLQCYGTSAVDLTKYVLKNAYDDNLGVPAAKLRDLMSLCDENRGIIPEQHRNFYRSLKQRDQGDDEN